jgi:hypothetical protein
VYGPEEILDHATAECVADCRLCRSRLPRHMLHWLLVSIGSWTEARFDQHLRHEFGDEAADACLSWLGYEKRVAGSLPRLADAPPRVTEAGFYWVCPKQSATKTEIARFDPEFFGEGEGCWWLAGSDVPHAAKRFEERYRVLSPRLSYGDVR